MSEQSQPRERQLVWRGICRVQKRPGRGRHCLPTAPADVMTLSMAEAVLAVAIVVALAVALKRQGVMPVETTLVIARLLTRAVVPGVLIIPRVYGMHT